MTGKLVFKMELFKILKDKKYIAITGVLAVLATIATGFFTFVSTRNINYETDFVSKIMPVMIILTAILFVAIMIFIYLFPFHVLSIDYKNNVMAMMIASGVNRTNLFFSKMGAVVIASLCVSIIILFGPFLIILSQVIANVGFNDMINSIIEFFKVMNFEVHYNIWQLLITQLLSVLNSAVIMLAATILMRGKNVTILLFMGFNMINGLITGAVLSGITFYGSVFSIERTQSVSIICTLVSTLVFGFIGLTSLKKQNL